jgi:hypothetical protein
MMAIIRLAVMTLLLFGHTSPQEYAGDAFRLGAGARSLGMGSAFIPVSDEATALYWNAAGLVQLDSPELQAQHAERFGGSVNHDLIVFGTPSSVGTFAVGLVRVAVDGITLSRLEDPSLPLSPGNRPVSSGEVGTSDYTLSLGYGRYLRENLSVGATVKLIWRNLEAGNGTGYGMDLSLLYAPREEWRIGFVLRDATRTSLTFDSGAKDTISPSGYLGVAHMSDISALHGRIIISSSLALNENSSAADSAQRLRMGAEYRHHKGLAGRLGLEGNHFTAGAGIEPTERIRVDVAFLENGDLDNTYRISATLSF